jgi:hypothetical protein
MKKITRSFDVLTAIIAVMVLHACAGTAGLTQCKTPTLTPPSGSGPGGEHHQRHDLDGDARGLFALHARRFHTDLRIVRSRHDNTSAERNRSCPHTYRVRKDVKGNRV